VTNTSANPARSTGPALFVGGCALAEPWLFWIAPMIGATLGGHTITAGGAFLQPLGVRGELGLGFVWMQPVSDPLLGTPNPRDQYGLETYWKLLVTPDLWVTPGVQFIINPSRNKSTDFVAIPQLKFRLFF
jgi:hypothetical protein